MNDPVSALLGSRRDRLGHVLGRYLVPALGVAAPQHVREHLLEEATELYWNELEWEHITHDAGDEAVERCFAGLLSFVRGLLVRVPAGQPGDRGPGPRPEVVEELLRFLAGRVVELDHAIGTGQVDGEPEKMRRELEMTDRLLDLVLYRWLELSPQEAARAEAVRSVH
jgi:hypothetical protein